MARSDLHTPCPKRDDRRWRCTVVHVDHFGNVITNVEQLAKDLNELKLSIKGQEFLGAKTFGDFREGSFVAYKGSSGHLELGITGGDLAGTMNIQIGEILDVLFL